MRSIRTGDTPVLMTCAPIPQTTPALRVLAATMAATTRRRSAAPRIAGSDSNHVLNDAPRSTGVAKSVACALLFLDASGYVRIPERSKSSYEKGMGHSH